MAQKSTLSGRTLKFDETLRPVMGRAIVYKENGEPALDQQCDHIREDARHGGVARTRGCRTQARPLRAELDEPERRE